MKIKLSVMLIIVIGSCIQAQWQQVSNGLTSTTVYGLTTDDNYIYAGTSGAGVFRSSDAGENWTAKNNGITGVFDWEISSIDNSLFTGIFGGGTFRSTDNGENWTELTIGSGIGSVRDFILHNSYIFANTWSNGVYRTSDNGDNWEAANNGMTSGGGWDMLSYGSYLFCSNGYGVYRSIDDGDNWTQVNNGLTSTTAYRLAQSGSYIFVGTYVSGIFRSSNFGDSWEPAGLNNSTIYALTSIGNNIFAGTSNSGVYLSTDNGNNWTDINTGLLNQGILCLAKDDIYLYAGTTGGGVFRRGIDNILSIQRISNSIPANFNLEQNYPNPFNPTTTIQFSIPEQTFVKLEIFNSLGEKVSTLVSEELNIGNYKYEWNAENLSSGIYHYKLTAKEFVQTKKLVLLK
jgi:photosystem II stability/assembly factor-like uncharacterized protein